MRNRALRAAALAAVAAVSTACTAQSTRPSPSRKPDGVSQTATGSPSASPPASTASASAAAPPPARRALGLHVAGNRIVNASGATVTLHGVDMSGTETTCAQNWTSDPFGGQPEDSPQTFAAMKSWGINAVRIPLNEDCWLGINGVEIGGSAYQAPIEKLVRDLEAAGLYVIVDLHWSAPGAQRAIAQNPAPDEDHSPAFWQGVASAFRGDAKVIFDLFNEPYYYWLSPGENAWTCLWQGCTLTEYVNGAPGQPYTVSSPWKTAGFDQLIHVIRAAGAPNLVMAAGVNWARDLSGWLAHRPSDPNVVASWHSYPSQNPALQSECAAQWCWDQVVAPLATRVPVVVGETGDSAPGPETYLPSFLPWARSHGLSVLAWTWNAWSDPSDVLVTSMTAGTPTAGEGALYQQYLRGLG